jgi:hypothetical protein
VLPVITGTEAGLRLYLEEVVSLLGDTITSQSCYVIVLPVITGTEAGLRLYLEEVVSLLGDTITSQSWATKAQAAAAMSSVASTLQDRLGPPHLGHLLQTLLAGLSGRTWTGKEALIQAIDTVCTFCR